MKSVKKSVINNLIVGINFNLGKHFECAKIGSGKVDVSLWTIVRLENQMSGEKCPGLTRDRNSFLLIALSIKSKMINVLC